MWHGRKPAPRHGGRRCSVFTQWPRPCRSCGSASGRGDAHVRREDARRGGAHRRVAGGPVDRGAVPSVGSFPIEPVHSAGTDNAIYRLGDDMAVRLPRIHGAVGKVDKEHRWLPRLAPRVPLAIPVPLGKGTPRTTPGLGRFIGGLMVRTRPSSALPIHAVRPSSWGASSPPCSGSIPTTDRALGSTTPSAACRWRSATRRPARRSPPWTARSTRAQPPGRGRQPCMRRRGTARSCGSTAVSLLGPADSAGPAERRHRLRVLGRGRPACDVMTAWTFLSAENREVFRAAVGVDDATWARGRGWALSFGLIALPYATPRADRLPGRPARVPAHCRTKVGIQDRSPLSSRCGSSR